MGPVHVEVRFQAQVRHSGDGPGLPGCCHLANDLLKDQPIMRSHSEQGGGCRCPPKLQDIWSPRDQLMSALVLPQWFMVVVCFARTSLCGFLPFFFFFSSPVASPAAG